MMGKGAVLLAIDRQNQRLSVIVIGGDDSVG